MTATEHHRNHRRFALSAGALYIALGIMQIVAGLGTSGRWSQLLYMEGGPVGGMALVLAGVVFLQGWRELKMGLREGVAFVYVGIVLALFFGGIELLRMGVNALGHLALGGEEYAGWSLLDDLTPALYLSVLPLAGLIAWRKSFDLNLIIPGERTVKDMVKQEEEAGL